VIEVFGIPPSSKKLINFRVPIKRGGKAPVSRALAAGTLDPLIGLPTHI